MADAGSIGALLAKLAERMPWQKAAGWDPVGLQIGDPAAPAGRVAVCHEVTDVVVGALEVEPADLLIAYHPLLFRPLTRLVAGSGPEGLALRLARAGVSLAVVHTAFDVCPGGAADALAEALELRDVSGFGPLDGPDGIKVATFVPAEHADRVLDAVARAGAGTVGAYTHCSFRSEGQGSFYAGAGTSPVVGESAALNLEPEVRIEFPAPRAAESAVVAALVAAHPYEEPAYDVYDRRGDAGLVGRIGAVEAGTTLAALAERVRAALRPPPLRIAGDGERPLERVAVVPGSGGDFAQVALAAGADALVTGDLTHHPARDALGRGLALLDPGHVATERPGLLRLLERVRECAPDARSLLAHDPDPWST
jgi:dinuclear metal center YbgI/SA1388 family protein